jgi:hypothetical protein
MIKNAKFLSIMLVVVMCAPTAANSVVTDAQIAGYEKEIKAALGQGVRSDAGILSLAIEMAEKAESGMPMGWWERSSFSPLTVTQFADLLISNSCYGDELEGEERKRKLLSKKGLAAHSGEFFPISVTRGSGKKTKYISRPQFLLMLERNNVIRARVSAYVPLRDVQSSRASIESARRTPSPALFAPIPFGQ